MFLPLHDKNPLRIVAFQFVTVCLIAACVGVFFWQLGLDQNALATALYAWGMVPAAVLSDQLPATGIAAIPEPVTLLSYQFLHSNWSHLLGNMLFLWVFGDNIEDAMGHARFIVFYLACGVIAALTHSFMQSTSGIPLIGASGAIAGLLGAYLVLHPRVKVLVLVLGRIPLRLPAYLLIIGWGLFQVYQAYGTADSAVAWWAHIGGFVAGMLLIGPMRDKRVPLFDRGVRH
jgi:membrane associated rhomboid family serine protease